MKELKKILLCSFVPTNTEQLPCFARLQAMMSLEEKTISCLRCSFSHGRDKFSVRVKQRRGGNLSLYDDI